MSRQGDWRSGSAAALHAVGHWFESSITHCLLYIMKTEKIKDELNDIHKELAYIRGMLQNVSNQMQELRDDIRGAPHQTEELRVRELYEHPWYEYKRQELVASRDYYGGPEGKQDISI